MKIKICLIIIGLFIYQSCDYEPAKYLYNVSDHSIQLINQDSTLFIYAIELQINDENYHYHSNSDQTKRRKINLAEHFNLKDRDFNQNEIILFVRTGSKLNNSPAEHFETKFREDTIEKIFIFKSL